MFKDRYGQMVYSEQDICNLYLADPDIELSRVMSEDSITFNPELELNNIPKVIKYLETTETIEEFDKRCSDTWHIPDSYRDFDIAKYVLDKCSTEQELQRAGHELMLYQERNMFMLLRYLKYLVDMMRSNNIVWGVGRGSSVSSYVLYLIGIHRINSLYYDLSIDEFLK